MATTYISASPKNPDSEKSKRYDRQLRLWGENGQQALETSHVCLINATAAGTETLKSLVLPGIRAFTIIDDHRITEDDADSNFFLCTAEQGSVLGEPRAKVAAQQLLEMNSDVKKGDWVEENFEALLDQPRTTTQPLFFTNFSLVVACGIESERALNKLSAHLWQLGVPLLVVKSLGFLGYLRLQVREHAVIEPHPDSHLEDLRLDAVWPELRAYFDSFPEDLTSLSRKELSQVPALVIIYRGLLRWRERCEKSGEQEEEPVPANYREKAQLKALIVEEMERFKEKEHQQKEKEEEEEKKCNDKEEEEDETDVQTGVGPALLDLENYEEALKMLNSVFTDSRRIPAGVQKLLDEVADEAHSHNQQQQQQQSSKNYHHHHHSQKARPNSSASFWAMISALRAFVAQFGTLPLAGSLPDMNCGSEQYARLQRIYRAKARADAEALLALLQKQQQKTCATTSTANGAAEVATAAAVSVSEADLALFCRNARFLTVLRCAGPMAEELTTGSAALRALASCPQLQSGADEGEGGEEGGGGAGSSQYDMLRLYLLMRLVDRFTGKHNRHPGQRDDEVESDIAELKREFRDLSSDLGCNMFIQDELIHEICRYGGCELHSISAFLGGCAAQEAVKLITGQYVPINNTFVYNGLTGTSVTYTL
ncbi:NEDD8-activating enzyme E1 regulatory subunit [Tyrophagus putrescentiae]|nr:NEDD8-activating enzyme E1 regulatory subunit [Tyrophagus putrescentiae]